MSEIDDDAGYYAILGIDPRASDAEVRRAYLRLSRQLHPDRRPDEEARKQMSTVGEAWAVLKNPRLRRAYDEEGREGVDNLSDFESSDDEENDARPEATALEPNAEVDACAPGAAGVGAGTGAPSASMPSTDDTPCKEASAAPSLAAPSVHDLAEAVAEAVRRTEERAARRYEAALASLLRELLPEMGRAEAEQRARDVWALSDG